MTNDFKESLIAFFAILIAALVTVVVSFGGALLLIYLVRRM